MYTKGAASTAPFVVKRPCRRDAGSVRVARVARRPPPLCLALAAVILAIGAAPARASTVAIELQPEGQDEDLAPNVIYTAAPGEANRLTASGDGSRFTIADPGAVITP